MGESRRRNKRNVAFFEKHPFCCFCGGGRPATTRDHVPSKQMFHLKYRPQGLEFPACEQCNHSTSPHELAAALLSRLTNYIDSKAYVRELRKLMLQVDKNRHGLLQELEPSWQQQYDFDNFKHPDIPHGWIARNAGGPLLNLSIQIFGAKLCKALHYEHTKKIIPKSGAIYVQWHSNHDRFTGKMPDELINQLPDPKTLEQGSWNVRDQFEYSYLVDEDENRGFYFATFQKSFAISGFVSCERNYFPELEGMKAHFPGEPFSL